MHNLYKSIITHITYDIIQYRQYNMCVERTEYGDEVKKTNGQRQKIKTKKN